jgi:hypothetical protein
VIGRSDGVLMHPFLIAETTAKTLDLPCIALGLFESAESFRRDPFRLEQTTAETIVSRLDEGNEGSCRSGSLRSKFATRRLRAKWAPSRSE